MSDKNIKDFLIRLIELRRNSVKNMELRRQVSE
jgi:hypothetical protein